MTSVLNDLNRFEIHTKNIIKGFLFKKIPYQPCASMKICIDWHDCKTEDTLNAFVCTQDMNRGDADLCDL